MSAVSKPIKTASSAAALERRRATLPSGVTGDGRFDTPYPVVFARAEGRWLFDVDGNRFLDYHGGYGTAVLGYAHPGVDGAVAAALRDGRAFVGCAHPYEAELAERLCSLLPEAERVALCGGGGTDALYHATRIARAVTGRGKVVKLEGGYQGWHGDLGVSTRPTLADPRPTRLPEAVVNSAGTLPAVTAEVLVVNANDVESLEERFARDGSRIAALIVEPVLYSAGCVAIDADYLLAARELCDRHGALLVFDEVLCGFRVRLGGAGALARVVPDLATYGKAVANGHILSLVCGRGDLIDQLAPGGGVFYSGTFNGHPLSCAAAMATLDELADVAVYEHINALTTRLADGINAALADHGVIGVCQHVGSGWCLYFGTEQVRGYRDLARISDARGLARNDAFRHFLRDRGVFMQRRAGTNRGFVSAAHRPSDIEWTIALVDEFIATLAAEGVA